MRLDIEKGARLTVEDGDCEGLRFVRWRPISLDSVPDALSCRAVSARTGGNEGAAVTKNRPFFVAPSGQRQACRSIQLLWRRSEHARPTLSEALSQGRHPHIYAAQPHTSAPRRTATDVFPAVRACAREAGCLQCLQLLLDRDRRLRAERAAFRGVTGYFGQS